MKGKKTSFTGGILAFLMFIYVFVQLFRAAFSEIETEKTRFFSADEVISAEGFVIRNEGIININDSGVIRYTAENGTKVSKNGVLAEIYSSQEQVQAQEQIVKLQQQIEQLKASQNKQEGALVDISTMDKQIFDSYLSAVKLTGTGEIIKAETSLSHVLNFLNRKQIISGDAENFNKRIQNFERLISQLKASAKAPQKKVTSDFAGYFVRMADGFENVVSFDKAKELTVTGLQAAQKSKKMSTEGVAGKIVRDFEWYIAVELAYKDVLKLPLGSSQTLKLPFSGVSQLPVKVAAINRDENKKKSIVIFECTYMNSELALIRNQPVQIMRKNYEGLKIPRRAIRISGGKTGVYVLKGSIAQFQPVNIIYSSSDYFLIKADEKVALFDEIIVKGKGLRNGTIVK